LSTLINIRAYIKQPYPFYYEDLKKVFFLLLFISIISFAFTFLFEPFNVNIDEHKIDSLWIVVLHSIIPIPIAFIYFYILNRTVKTIENWNLGKEFFHLAIVLLIIGLASFLIRDLIYTNSDNWSFRYLWEEIRNTFLVGSLLLLIILPLNLHRLIYKHTSVSKQLPDHQNSIEKTKSIIQINTPIAGRK